MEMILQRMIFGSEAFSIDAHATGGCRSQATDGVSASGKQYVPQPYDPLMDLESTQLMEERYGIREEGLF